MVDREAPRSRRAALFSGTRLDWWLVLGTIAIWVFAYLLDDRTDWSGGFGYDGRFYGELAKNFGSAVFGDGAVVPPGLVPYDGPAMSGVDSYYAFRILPSGLVWAGLNLLGLSPTTGNVIRGFAALDLTMFALATFCWCRSAGLLGLGDRAKILGAVALIVNFAVIKTGTYYPVLTDHVGLGLGALCMYLWLRGATPGLALAALAGCFAWPPFLVIGPLLLVFPASRDARERLAEPEPAGEQRESRRPAAFGVVVGGVVALVAVVTLTAIQLSGYTAVNGTEQLPLFPLSVAITGLYIFVVFAYLLPRGGLRETGAILRGIPLARLATAVALVAVVLVAAELLARRPGFSSVELFKDAFWSTTLDPGLFLVALLCYWGPILFFVFADMPRVARDAWRLGPGMVAMLGAGLLAALLTQPREVVAMYPFLVLAGVLAARRIYPLTGFGIGVFALISLVLSRIWFHIGEVGIDTSELQEFPAQRYFMATGTWTSSEMYAVQLGAVALIGLMLWLVARRRRPA